MIKGRCKVREVGTFLGQEVETLVTGLDAGVCKRAQAARLNSRWIGVFFSCTRGRHLAIERAENSGRSIVKIDKKSEHVSVVFLFFC